MVLIYRFVTFHGCIRIKPFRISQWVEIYFKYNLLHSCLGPTTFDPTRYGTHIILRHSLTVGTLPKTEIPLIPPFVYAMGEWSSLSVVNYSQWMDISLKDQTIYTKQIWFNNKKNDLNQHFSYRHRDLVWRHFRCNLCQGFCCRGQHCWGLKMPLLCLK